MLPSSSLTLIREYSKPLSRPDWRTFQRTITTNIFINEINALYRLKRTYKLYNLLHTNMHNVTQEEFDSLMKYKDDKLLYTIIIYLVNVGLSGYIGILLARLRVYQPTNNVIIDNFIYINIWFRTLYLVYQIGYNMGEKISHLYK
jgi:hypothetical protein